MVCMIEERKGSNPKLLCFFLFNARITKKKSGHKEPFHRLLSFSPSSCPIVQVAQQEIAHLGKHA